MASDDAASGARRRWFKILGPSTTNGDVTDPPGEDVPTEPGAALDTADDLDIEIATETEKEDIDVIEEPVAAEPAGRR